MSGKDKKTKSCPPCDAETMARRLGFKDVRRVQQLAKEGAYRKNERGEYLCEHNVIARIAELSRDRTTKASGLTKKREESIEIRNQKARMEALKEWEAMVLMDAVVKELAPVVVALKSGLRELRSAMANQVWLFVKEHAAAIVDKQIADHEGIARVQEMLGKPMDEKLAAFARDIEAWKERKKK